MQRKFFEIKENDVVEAYTDLKCGDWVAIERIGATRLAIIALSEAALHQFPGKTYQINRGSTSDRIVLSRVSDEIVYD